MLDDSIDQLEVFAEFLGDEEFSKVKEQYEKALQTMDLIY